MRVGGERNTTAATLHPGRIPGTGYTGGWGSSRSSLDGCENLPRTGIRSPDRLARSDYGVAAYGARDGRLAILLLRMS